MRTSFRIQLFIFLALICGILLGFTAFIFSLDTIVFGVLFGVLIFSFAFVFCTKLRHKITIIFIVVTFIFGSIYSYLTFCSYENDNSPSGTTLVSATIESLTYGENEYYAVLTKVSCDGESLDGKIYATISGDNDYFEEGDNVTFYSTIYKYETYSYGVISSKILKGIKYRTSVGGGLSSENGYSFFGGIRTSIRNILYNNLDEDTASTCYAMLTGTTSEMDDDTISLLRISGVSHVFCVSGMHIMVLFYALQFLCKMLKARKRWGDVLCFLIVLLYSGVCGFSVSSLRAVIMCGIYVMSTWLFVDVDALNSLSTAGIIILVLHPLDLFSSGFLLSMTAVLGHILFKSKIERGLKWLPKTVKSSISSVLSVQLGTTPTITLLFGYFSVASIFLNLIFLPLFSMCYILLIFATTLSLPLSIFGLQLVTLASLPISAIISIISFLSTQNTLIFGIGGCAFACIYALFFVFYSDFFLIKQRVKFGINIIAILTTLFYIFYVTFFPFGMMSVSVGGFVSGGYVLLRTNDATILIVLSDSYTTYLQSFLTNNNVSNVDAVFVIGDGYNFLYNLDISYTNGYYYDEITSQYQINNFSIEYINASTIIVEHNSNVICVSSESVNYSCNLLVADNSTGGDIVVNFSSGSSNYCIYEKGVINFLLK